MSLFADAEDGLIDEAGAAIHAPKVIDLLIGHEGAIQSFEAGYASGRLAQSWLLTGPEGIGKGLAARQLARRMLVSHSGMDTLPPLPDASHPVSRRLQEGSHSDVRIVEPEASGKPINVEMIRHLQEFMRLTAAEGQWRVAIIDPAEAMNVNAANALLKILEEPPKNCLIFLISHMPGKLLPTIRSRCRQLTFLPLSDAEMARVLETHGMILGAEDLQIINGLAVGSPGIAMMLAEFGAAEAYRQLLSVMQAYPHLEMDAITAFADAVAAKKQEEKWPMVPYLLSGFLHRLTSCAAGALSNDRLLEAEKSVFPPMIAQRSLDSWLDLWDITRNLLHDTQLLHLDRRQTVMDWCFQVEGKIRSLDR